MRLVCSPSSWSSVDRVIQPAAKTSTSRATATTRKEIEQAIKELDYFNDPEAYDKEQELRAMDICCDAIIILGKEISRSGS